MKICGALVVKGSVGNSNYYVDVKIIPMNCFGDFDFYSTVFCRPKIYDNIKKINNTLKKSIFHSLGDQSYNKHINIE